jgi:predicted nucleic acid-binding protein
VTEFELLQGAVRAPKEFRAIENQKVKKLLAQLKIVEFDSECAQRAAEINGTLMNTGTPIGVMDVFIAATALRLGLPLITSNLRDFSRINGLTVINWRWNR